MSLKQKLLCGTAAIGIELTSLLCGGCYETLMGEGVKQIGDDKGTPKSIQSGERLGNIIETSGNQEYGLKVAREGRSVNVTNVNVGGNATEPTKKNKKMDWIIFKNGNYLDGKIIDKTETGVTIKAGQQELFVPYNQISAFMYYRNEN